MPMGFRRPWPVTRRDTDSVALNIIGDDKKTKNGKGGSDIDVSVGEVSPTQIAQTAEELKEFEVLHKWDPNLPEKKRDQIESAVKFGDIEGELHLANELEDDSPYPEVRAAVRNYDEDAPANTFRAWTLGLVFATIGSALNMLFSLRAPTIQITAVVGLLVAFPFGLLWAKFMPKRTFNTFGYRWSLNPGPFNLKEHALITIMANASYGQGAAYSFDTLTALQAKNFYNRDLGWGFALLFTITTQALGYGLAGMYRRFLVWPAAMIWPNQLPLTALFYALHDRQPSDPAKTGGWSIARYRYFLYVFIGAFVWYWFPGFIWQGLSVFAFVTWIRPNNAVVNQLFGGFTGLSLLPITFDWTQIAGYNLSPLMAPWHAIANTLIGTITFFIITAIGIHYTGAFYSKYLPMSDSSSYDNTGMTYNVTRILTPEFSLDLKKYQEYSPLFLSTTFALTYGVSFATITAVIIHTGLFNGREILLRAKAAREQEDDVHMKLMKKYPEAPDWWYLALSILMLGMALGTVLGYDTRLDWWAFFICCLISVVWMVPIGMIQAVTNIAIGLNVLTEFLVGYMQPGKPLAMMVFKTYGYMVMYQGITFTMDLKLGHYMKVPPRTLFSAQIISVVWTSIVQVAVQRWAFGTIEGVCTQEQKNHYTCPNGRVFFNASIIWGLIGPKRIFSPGSIYDKLQWFWLVGAALPVTFYVLARLYPKTNLRYLNAPVMLGGTGSLPPATPLNYLSWGIVGYIFNKLIRDWRRGWWMGYNYITSAALDSGLAISTILIFLTLDLTNTAGPSWWGNSVVETTMDAQYTAVQATVPPGEIFGPKHW
ncbi:MAG: hypothetical protein M1819_007336 [Sarea resinae]|nr:MAG: hypothetical protein M1819_007336 [Sarea resinae]